MKPRTQQRDLNKGRFGSGVARMVLGLLSTTALVSCFSLFECANTVLFEVPSPKNKWVATVFERDCGATTAANNQLLIHASNRKPEFEKGQSVLVYQGSKDLRVEWVDDQKVKVWIPAGANIFKKDGQSMGVQVVYLESPAAQTPEAP